MLQSNCTGHPRPTEAILTGVSIGRTLAEAREAAGLTVADVSARTRIRTPLIRAIEADDFRQCGGDFYVRGHIRAIARVVGVDSRPLVADYDSGHHEIPPVGIEDLFLPAPDPAPPVPEQPSGAEPAPAPAGEAPAAEPAPEPEPAPATAPATPTPTPTPTADQDQDQHPGHAAPRRRIPASLLLLAVAALAVIGGGAYELASGNHTHSTASGTTASQAPPRPTLSAHSSAPPTAQPSASPSAKPPSPSPSVSPTHALLTTQMSPDSASADDNSGDASKALSGHAGDPWHTQWYTSATFGNLKSGTGLTLTLPRTVTASGITVKFGDSGGSMQVKAGTSQGSLRTVAHGPAGGTVHLSFSKTSARYIELWFTKLGSDSSGYQVAVYDVSVSAVKS